MAVIRGLLAVLLVLLVQSANAQSYGDMRVARPEFFHPETGYRIDKQRAPTPQDIPPPAKRISALKARQMLSRGAIAVDVFGAAQSRYDELDGTWLVSEPRMSLPDAVWLPEVGRGVLDETMQRYLETQLIALTKGSKSRAIVVFCVADCWMSWNAAQRIAGLGYLQVFWLRLGTDGWRELGWTLAPVTPVPVNVD